MGDERANARAFRAFVCGTFSASMCGWALLWTAACSSADPMMAEVGAMSATGMQPAMGPGAQQPTPTGGAPAMVGSPPTGGPAPSNTGGAGTPSAGTAAGGSPAVAPAEDAGSIDSGRPVVSDPPCATDAERSFSFFMVSLEAVVRESGNSQGFGGNFGGIAGADDICRRVALSSSDCAGTKTWRAFLSTTSEDAIDRIGSGPWHDRRGRLLANDVSELLHDRPINADPLIIDDLPNEFGVPNRNPDGTGPVDNHQTLTGSGTDGRLYTQAPSQPPMGGRGGSGGGFGTMTTCQDGEWTPEKATCWNWTVAEPRGCPRVGHSWPRQGSGINWISVWNERGCAPGIVLDDRTAPTGASVGAFGGYGGFYCFAKR